MQSKHGTLTGGVVATETFTQDNGEEIVVHMVSGTGPVYFTVDGSTPSAAGDDTLVVFGDAASGTRSRCVKVLASDSQTVKLISATADGYSVEVFD